MLFHDDNAQVQSSCVAHQKLTRMRFELLPYPSYLPDLVHMEFHLYQKHKTFLAGQKFVCNEKAIQAADDYFKGLEEKHFRKGIGNL